MLPCRIGFARRWLSLEWPATHGRKSAEIHWIWSREKGERMKRTIIAVLFLIMALAATLAFMRKNSPGGAVKGTPSILFFTASPVEVARGESVTLDWETQVVDSVKLEWGPESNPRGNLQRREGLPPAGSLTLPVQEDTIFVLECETGPVQMCTQSASVRVR